MEAKKKACGDHMMPLDFLKNKRKKKNVIRNEDDVKIDPRVPSEKGLQGSSLIQNLYATYGLMNRHISGLELKKTARFGSVSKSQI